MRRRHATITEMPDEFFRGLKDNSVPRVPGTAIFLTRLYDDLVSHYRARRTNEGAVRDRNRADREI